MSRTDYAPRQEYMGAGNLDTYTFDFKIEALDQLLILMIVDGNVELIRDRGDDLSAYVDSVTFDAVAGGGTVVLADNLPVDYTLVLLQANDEPTQTYEFKSKSSFTLARIEGALDLVVGAVQRLAYRAGRSIQVSDMDDIDGFDPMLPVGLVGGVSLIPSTNDSGTGWAPIADWTSVPDLDAAIAAAAASAASAAAAAAAAANSATSAADASQTAVDVSDQLDDAEAAAVAAAASAVAAAASQTAAATSATNAATSASAASTSATNAATSASAASTSATNAAGSETAASASASSAATSASAASGSATAAALSAAAAALSAAAADGVPVISGTRAAPVAVVAANGIVFTSSGYYNIHFLQGSGGAVDISMNPQIQAGTVLGQKLMLIGRSDTNTIKIEDGTGVKLRGGGEMFLFADVTIEFVWDGTNWVQIGA